MVKDKHLHKRSLIRLSISALFTVLFIGLSIVGLVMNSHGAKSRYEQLIAVDQAGGDVEAALNELRGYIYSHMNTQIGSDTGIRPPIQLKGTYERLVEAEVRRVEAANEALYTEAQADCERRLPQGFFGGGRVQCIADYIDANGEKVQSINEDLYKFDFTPPVWSPDLAGISILIAILSGLVFLIDLFTHLNIKRMINA